MAYNRLIQVLFTIVFVLQFFSVQAQLPNRPNAYGIDRAKTGDWIYYYDYDWNEISPDFDSAAYYRLITYERGKPIGTMGDYYANGIPQMIGTMVSEEPEVYEGNLVFYNELGDTIQLDNWQNGYLKEISFYDELGKVFESQHWSKGNIKEIIGYGELGDTVRFENWEIGKLRKRIEFSNGLVS